jgi:hypothetical protein
VDSTSLLFSFPKRLALTVPAVSQTNETPLEGTFNISLEAVIAENSALFGSDADCRYVAFGQVLAEQGSIRFRSLPDIIAK